MADGNPGQLVQADQKFRQPLVSVPFTSGNSALKNRFEIAFEPLPILAAIGKSLPIF